MLVDGRDVRDYSMQHLRDAIAMVLQKNTLFSGTLRDNLRWGKKDASDEELLWACRIACADEFLSRLEKGLDTEMGQGGVNVSGGQKQRLCIARALLKHPKILILDDSTSAVDTATEAKIRARLAAALPGMTKIIIAQRISSVRHADVIFVLDNGRLCGAGHARDAAANKPDLPRNLRIAEAGGGSVMAKVFVYRKPRDTKKTLLHLGRYLGFHKWTLALVALLVLVSTAANVVGTYLFRPIINDYILPGDIPGLVRALAAMGVMYALGALATLGYSQLMVHAAQRWSPRSAAICSHMCRSCRCAISTQHPRRADEPLHKRRRHRAGGAEQQLLRCFLQSFFTLAGTLGDAGGAQRAAVADRCGLPGGDGAVHPLQQPAQPPLFPGAATAAGRINGFVEEMVAGQKVEKVFNHEQADFEEFCRRNEALRKAATSALTYSGLMVPMNVSLSYANYAVSACVGGLFALAGRFDLGRACGLPCVCAPKRPAAQSAFAAGQLHPGGTVGRGAHFRPDGRAGGAGRGRCDTVPREEGRVRRAGAG